VKDKRGIDPALESLSPGTSEEVHHSGNPNRAAFVEISESGHYGAFNRCFICFCPVVGFHDAGSGAYGPRREAEYEAMFAALTI
jgi:hypothetical protein